MEGGWPLQGLEMDFGANVLAPGVRGLIHRSQIESLGSSAAFKSTLHRSQTPRAVITPLIHRIME